MFTEPFFENHNVYEIMWKNILETSWPKMRIWRMRVTYCIPKATNTVSEYVTVIAFLPQE